MPRKFPLVAGCSGCHETQVLKVKFLCGSCYGKLHYLHNKERHNANGKKYYRQNPDVFKRRYERVKSNPKRKETSKKYRENNPEKCREAVRNHYKNNKAYYAARSNRREKHIYRMYQKLPKKHRKQIIEFYKLCPEGYHVDHIIPIKGKEVSGLHVIWNLQYLLAKENLRKGNKLEST